MSITQSPVNSPDAKPANGADQRHIRIIQTINSVAESYGGPSRSVTALCRALAEHGCEVRLISRAIHREALLAAGRANHVVVPRRESMAARLPDLWRFRKALQMELSVDRPDVVHDHGAWLPTNIIAAQAARSRGVPLVVSTRGMFSPSALARSRIRKAIAFRLYQRSALDGAAALHATSAAEASDLRACGLTNAIAVIPNGVHLPAMSRSGARRKRIVYLGRLHPIKGLPMLLDAWAAVRRDDWTLEITGPGPAAYRAELERRSAQLGLGHRVVFREAITDDERAEYLGSARLLVLPSSSENFGMTVAEALASGVPAIATSATPWSQLVSHSCGWWIEPTSVALAKALQEAMSSPPGQLDAMGARGRDLVATEYSWDAVAVRVSWMYEWLAGRASRPSYVQPRISQTVAAL